MKKILLGLIIIFNCIIACSKDEPCDNLIEAKLFYAPSCATINGYITTVKDGKTYTFQQEIDQEFQKDGINVLISFEKLSPRPLTADCFQNTVVKLNCIKSN